MVKITFQFLFSVPLLPSQRHTGSSTSTCHRYRCHNIALTLLWTTLLCTIEPYNRAAGEGRFNISNVTHLVSTPPTGGSALDSNQTLVIFIASLTSVERPDLVEETPCGLSLLSACASLELASTTRWYRQSKAPIAVFNLVASPSKGCWIDFGTCKRVEFTSPYNRNVTFQSLNTLGCVHAKISYDAHCPFGSSPLLKISIRVTLQRLDLSFDQLYFSPRPPRMDIFLDSNLSSNVFVNNCGFRIKTRKAQSSVPSGPPSTLMTNARLEKVQCGEIKAIPFFVIRCSQPCSVELVNSTFSGFQKVSYGSVLSVRYTYHKLHAMRGGQANAKRTGSVLLRRCTYSNCSAKNLFTIQGTDTTVHLDLIGVNFNQKAEKMFSLQGVNCILKTCYLNR